MSWIHYVVDVSHCAECHENRLVTVWEMLINLRKFPIPQWWGTWKSDPESVSGTGSTPKLDQFFRLVGPIMRTPKFQWNRLITFVVILHTHTHTHTHTERIADKPSWSHNLLLGGGNNCIKTPERDAQSSLRVDAAAGQKAVAKRRSLGSIIRSRLGRVVKPSGRSLSADRAVQRPPDLEPARRDLDTGPLTPPPQSTYRTSVGKFSSTQYDTIVGI